MKNIIVTIVMLMEACIANAQNFNKVCVNKEKAALSFSVKNEINVSYYLVLAGNEKSQLDPISRIKPNGNTVLSQNYTTDLLGMNYSYYQIVQVKNDGQQLISDIAMPEPSNKYKQQLQFSNITNNSIAGK